MTESLTGFYAPDVPAIRIPDRQVAAHKIVQNLLEAHSGTESIVALKQMEDIIKRAIGLVKEVAIGDLRGKTETIFGASVTTRGVREYDYGNDATLASLESDAKAISEKLKARKSFLESLTAPMADTTTGEIAEPAKLVKNGLNIFVTLPK